MSVTVYNHITKSYSQIIVDGDESKDFISINGTTLTKMETFYLNKMLSEMLENEKWRIR